MQKVPRATARRRKVLPCLRGKGICRAAAKIPWQRAGHRNTPWERLDGHCVGIRWTPDGKMRRKRRSKAGFKTKKEAIAYLPILAAAPEQKKSITFKELYDRWLPTHRAGKDTINCYKAA